MIDLIGYCAMVCSLSATWLVSKASVVWVFRGMICYMCCSICWFTYAFCLGLTPMILTSVCYFSAETIAATRLYMKMKRGIDNEI